MNARKRGSDTVGGWRVIPPRSHSLGMGYQKRRHPRLADSLFPDRCMSPNRLIRKNCSTCFPDASSPVPHRNDVRKKPRKHFLFSRGGIHCHHMKQDDSLGERFGHPLTGWFVLCLSGILLDLVPSKLALFFHLPLFLDSIGTIWAGALGGPFSGMRSARI